MICTTDTKGRAMWIVSNPRDLEQSIKELRARREKYRLVKRTISALGGSAVLTVLVILGT